MADEQKEQCTMTLAPLPETKRGYGVHLYASKNGKFAYGNGKSVVIRDLADPSKATTFHGHKFKVNVANFSPNGEWIASGDDEGKVIVWSVANQKVKNEVYACGRVLDIQWGPDGKRILAVGAGLNERAKVFSWDSGNNLGAIQGHSKDILSAAYKPNRPFRLATSSEDLSVKFFNGPPFKFSHSFDGHERYPNRVRYSPDGSILVTVGSDKQIVVFDGKEGTKTGELKSDDGHKGAIYGFDFSPCGKKIVTVSSDKTAKLWDIESSTVEGTWSFGKDVLDMQMGALWAKDHLITVSLSGALNYLDASNPGTILRTVHGHKSSIQGLSVDTKNGKFYTADMDGQLCSWDKESGAATWFSGKGHGKTIAAVQVTCDGENVVTVGLDDTLRVNSTKTLETDSEGEQLGGEPVALAVGNKNAGLAAVILAQDKLVVTRDGKVVSTTDLGYTPTAVAFSQDDTRLAVGSKKNSVHVYSLDKDTPTLAVTHKKHTRAVCYLAYSPCGKYLTSIGKGRKIYHWPADGNNDSIPANKSGWPFHSQTVNQITFSPSGAHMVTCAQDENLLVWHDLEKFTAKRDTYKLVHKGGVSNVLYWDENSVITVGDERSIKYFSV